jgi:hypothetical protein
MLLNAHTLVTQHDLRRQHARQPLSLQTAVTPAEPSWTINHCAYGCIWRDFKGSSARIRWRLASYSALSRPCANNGVWRVCHPSWLLYSQRFGNEYALAGLPGITKLKRVSLKEIWGDKARNFTPWLATDEALGLLSEVIGRV